MIKNTLKEVGRKFSRYFTTSQTHFSTEGNNLDQSDFYSELKYAQTNFGFVT